MRGEGDVGAAAQIRLERVEGDGEVARERPDVARVVVELAELVDDRRTGTDGFARGFDVFAGTGDTTSTSCIRT